MNYLIEVSNVIQSYGLQVGTPELDGKIKRVALTEKSTFNKNGWYIGWQTYINGKDFVSCVIGNWSTNERYEYKSWLDDKDYTLNDYERIAIENYQKAMVQKIKSEESKKHKAAAQQAKQQWQVLAPTGDSEYLTKKQIKPYGARFGTGFITLPVMNLRNEIVGLQHIYDNGEKRFLAGTPTKGNFQVIGNPTNGELILFSESFSTTASIHESTNRPVVNCFNVGNLKPVIEAWRKIYPKSPFIICADNDQWKDSGGNVGLDKANEIAKTVANCMVVYPDFEGLDTNGKPTDFNDLHILAGLEKVQSVIESAIKNTEFVIDDTITNGELITPADCPTFRVYDDWQDGKRGVIFYDFHNGTIVSNWLCAPLHVDAVTYDKYSNNYGRYLRFKPTSGKWRNWCMPMELLEDTASLLRELRSMGLEICTNKKLKELLIAYINGEHPKTTFQIATQTGWHHDAFLLPDKTIGNQNYFYQSEHFNRDNPYRTAGTLVQWQQNIARYCVGNPLLILSVCTAFAGALLNGTNQQGGGFHIFGESSKGKSTGLFAACSVFGCGKDYWRTWLATGNGLEAVATLFNDSLLALDEINECEPREVGAIVYMLGNGIGKARANKFGNARQSNQWRVMILSNGERSVEDAMREGGKQIKAGQAMRLLSIPLFGEYGAFNDLHDKKTGRELSNLLQDKSKEFYGVAGETWLQALIDHKPDLNKLLENQENELNKWIDTDNLKLNAQEYRALRKFALIALAGDLATQYGVTGWDINKTVIISSIYQCFRHWQAQNGTDSSNSLSIEQQQVLQAVKEFIQKHGDSRFTDLDDHSDKRQKTINRAGYKKRDTNGQTIWLFNDAGIKECLIANDQKQGIKTLKQCGWLDCETKGYQKLHRVDGNQERFYTVKIPEITP